MRTIIIVGGGLAGLVAAIYLRQNGLDVLLIEKKQYPFHKVCGEYISNEVKPFLKQLGIFPDHIDLSQIDTFRLSSTSGKEANIRLGLGGFGISRYTLDNHLYEYARGIGVEVMAGTSVKTIDYHEHHFNLTLNNQQTIDSLLVIGAYGKRSSIDKKLNRSFIQKRSPYIGVKYHINYDCPSNEVALHNFKGGYCGINQVENGKVNLCYLSTRENLKKYGQIDAMEEHILQKNPLLKDIFQQAEFLFEKPEVINEISFETKEPVENHMLMCGDAAGMIAPLCGNGMAMAIHTAKIASECIFAHYKNGKLERQLLELDYQRQWKSLFARRLAIGRQLQGLFGEGFLSGIAVSTVKNIKPLARFLIEKTHGKPF